MTTFDICVIAAASVFLVLWLRGGNRRPSNGCTFIFIDVDDCHHHDHSSCCDD